MRKLNSICFILFMFCQFAEVKSQINPRLYNEKYTQTFFLEEFNGSSLNRNIWDVVVDWKRNHTINIWADSANTVSQSNGYLNLSMIHSPGYTCINPDGIRIYADFIAGEVKMKEAFLYGSYECRAFLASANGAFPAFWAMGINPCSTMPNNEIDFLELKADHSNPTLDNGIFYYTVTCGTAPQHKIFNKSPFSWEGWHTFKCIWSPIKITYWVDDTLTLNVYNNGEYWYPQYPLQIILSQQVTSPDTGNVVTPQTTNFDYIRFKKFFLAPEITISNTSCLTSTATMDVATEATNVSWQLTPSSLFTTLGGTGKVANIVKAFDVQGFGKITYTFQMPGGETFTAEKEFWVGLPATPEISSSAPFNWSSAYGYPAVKEFTVISGQGITFYDENINTYGGLIQDFEWEWSSDNVDYLYDVGAGQQTLLTFEPGTVRIRTKVTNLCGETEWSLPVFVVVTEEEYRMSISPNPASDETTIEIESSKKDKTIKKFEWDLEVFDQSNVLKAKTSKLKENSTIIKTSGWRDGVYIVRAKIDNKIISEKLVVKH